jgi:hypothetical protein
MDDTRHRRRSASRPSLAIVIAVLAALVVVAPDVARAAPAEECTAAPSAGPAAVVVGSEISDEGPESMVFRAESEARAGRASAHNLLTSFVITGITVVAEDGALPASISLASDAGQRFSLERGGLSQAARFDLPGLPARCLALSWKARAGRLAFTIHTSATPEALVRALAGRGDERLQAISLLPRLGAAAVDALEAAFDSMPPREKRDALRVYAQLAKKPRARARLITASTDSDPAVRRLAVDALEGPALVEAARRGSREAWLKASSAQPGLVVVLALEQLGGAPPFEDTRRAMRKAMARLGPEGPEALLEVLLEQEPTVRARAIEALVTIPSVRPHLLQPLQSLLGEASESGEPLTDAAFERLYRATLAARAYDEEAAREALAPGLARLRAAHEWMLRAAAYEALASLGAERSLLEPGFGDPYPRVREAALAAAASTSGAKSIVGPLRDAAADPWPSVRARAIELAAGDGLLLGDVDDRSPRVRLAVVVSWMEREERESALRRALRREHDLAVKGGFLAAATDRCVEGFAGAARDVLEAAQANDGDAAHAGEAMLYLLAFEGETRDTLLAALAARGAPTEALTEPPRCLRKNEL